MKTTKFDGTENKPRVYHAEVFKVSFLLPSQGYKFAALHNLGIKGYAENSIGLTVFTFTQDKE